MNHIQKLTLSSCAALALLAVPFAPATAQSLAIRLRITQVDTSAFPQVKVFISALNDAGEPVAIRADQISLLENGQRITPQEAHGIGNSEPLTAFLVVDVSGSMLSAGKLEAAREAARAFVQQMQPGEAVGVLAFNTQIDVLQPITTNPSELLQAIDRLKAERYNTAMYDALIRAEEMLSGISGRKAIIVLTDGVDNQSQRTAENVVDGGGASGLSISTIGLGEPAQGRATAAGLDESALQDLASKTGGSYAYVNDAAALRDAYKKLGKALQSEYVLSYTSPAQYRDGVSRSLTVSLGTAAIGGTGAQAAYNPGGLIPEVPQNATWPIFLLLIFGLTLLLFLPAGVRFVQSQIGSLRSTPSSSKVAAPRIHLKDIGPSRIKIK
jgi:Ca-activated chloride channel homolog